MVACAEQSPFLCTWLGGRDGYVQVAQGKLQEHDGRGRMEQARYCQSVDCVYFEVRCQLTIIVTDSSRSNSSEWPVRKERAGWLLDSRLSRFMSRRTGLVGVAWAEKERESPCHGGRYNLVDGTAATRNLRPARAPRQPHKALQHAAETADGPGLASAATRLRRSWCLCVEGGGRGGYREWTGRTNRTSTCRLDTRIRILCLPLVDTRLIA